MELVLKTKQGWWPPKKHISTLNKLPEIIRLLQGHSHKEEHGLVSLLKDGFLTIPKRKWKTEN